MGSPQETRERIMDSAQALILERGFAGTSVGSVVKAAGLTKGAFFHHFQSKDDLGFALVERYAAKDHAYLADTMERASSATDDPVDRLLLFVRLLEEGWSELEVPYSCLFASYTSELGLLSPRYQQAIEEALRGWSRVIRDWLVEATERHPPTVDLDVEAVADMLIIGFEGSFVVSRAVGDPAVVSRQLHQYGVFLSLIFGRAGTD